MNKMEISTPTIEEFEQVCSLAKEYKLDCENLQLNQFIIARINKQMIGFVRLKEYPDYVELSTLGVLSKFRYQGIGQFLTKQLIRMRHTEKIYIITSIPKYFIKFGFKQTCDIPRYLASKRENCKTKCNSNKVTVMTLILVNSLL